MTEERPPPHGPGRFALVRLVVYLLIVAGLLLWGRTTPCPKRSAAGPKPDAFLSSSAPPAVEFDLPVRSARSGGDFVVRLLSDGRVEVAGETMAREAALAAVRERAAAGPLPIALGAEGAIALGEVLRLRDELAACGDVEVVFAP